MEMTNQGLNLHIISLRRQVPNQGKILETLQLKKLIFPTARPDAQMPKSGQLAQNLIVL
jgi:hypothetical protein